MLGRIEKLEEFELSTFLEQEEISKKSQEHFGS